MEKSRTIPLASGLLGREYGSIYGQLEVSLADYKTIHIAIRRKPYTDLSDIEFSVPFTDLKEIIIVLCEAQEKLNGHWLSIIATKEAKARS